MKRLNRLTLARSKKSENFEAAVGLHFATYNTRASLKDYIARLEDLIKNLHSCESVHERTAEVREVFQGKIIWRGAVEVFNLKGHPKASQCYAWSNRDDGKEYFTAVLSLPPVNSPEKAVRATIRAQLKDERKET